MKNKTLQSWLLATLIAVGSAGLIYAQINSVTGVGQGTDWPHFTSEMDKKPNVLKRFNAGLHYSLPTPTPAGGLNGGYAWATDITGNINYITSDSAAKGVQLFAGDKGDIVFVVNVSATAANIYPADGGKLNGGSANVGAVIPASKGIVALCQYPNNWYAFDLPARATAVATPTASPTATPTASP